MQTWEYDLIPATCRPPYSPAELLEKRARLVSEVLTMMVEDLEVDTPTQIAITVAHLLDLGETLCQQTRAEVDEDMDLGYEEEQC